MQNRLKELRITKGKTQLQVQMDTGVEQALLSKFENGVRIPPTDTLMLFADYYGVSMDSIMAAGLPDGNYKLGVNDVVVKDGDAKLADTGVRAGSTLTQNVALKNLLAFTGRPLEEILLLLTENPAKLLKIFDTKGSIADGKDADLVVLDEANEVADVFVGGRKLLKDY